jgi:hypothetical protein
MLNSTWKDDEICHGEGEPDDDDGTSVIAPPWQRKLRYMYAWLVVRPRRWFFGNMGAAAYIHWFPSQEWYGWRWPNIHWHLLYLTVFRFCNWLYWDGWRPFCDWTGGYRRIFPWIARTIQAFGRTTAGYHCSGGECYHCGSPEGDQVDLSEDETGSTFILEESWTVGTQDGTDHRFRGVTICPKCGYRDEYEDGSL